MGGERKQVEVAEFPTLGKTVLRVGGEARLVDSAALEVFWPPKDIQGE